jgi:ABC-type lipoprotein export system ATPase subunit
MLKSYKKEDHDEHAPDSVRDSEMHSEMMDLSHRKESELESFHKAEAHTA